MATPSDESISQTANGESDPEDVEIVARDGSAKRKGFKVAIFVEYFGISMEIAWRHLIIIVISAMKKYEANQILWARHPNFLTLWPAKVAVFSFRSCAG